MSRTYGWSDTTMKSRMLAAAALLTLALGACSDGTADQAGTSASGVPTTTGTAVSSATATAPAGPSGGPQTTPGSTSTQGNATQTDTLVAFTRTGGLAGVNDKLTVRPDGSYTIQTKSGSKNGKLSGDELAALKAALVSTDFNKMPTVNDNGSVADGYTYTITYAGKQITAKDGAIPPALQPVISALGGFLSK
ncbi:hypothetical protein AB0M46_35845 [Dactylosporangium sp. NPDC051485]|uniref:hypothetical protein n=1 Tax=Dactylosporangium sp. NPDC051485 TaxID=3154846 RepID=UPI00343F8977